MFTNIELSLIKDISMALITGVILPADGNGKNKTKRKGGTHIWICVTMEHLCSQAVML